MLNNCPTVGSRAARTAAVCLLAVAGPAQALELTPVALEQLRRGEPVTSVVSDPKESGAGRVEAVIDVPASADTVWRILTDCNLSMTVMSGLKACRIISRNADGSDIREHAIGLSRLLPTMKSVFQSTYVINREIRFARTDGDLKRLTGLWRLEPQAAGIRLHYAADIALGVPVPAMLLRSALESDMPKTLKAIRKAASGS